MTHTVNGIGTHLSGSEELTEEEFNEWGEKLPYIHGLTKSQLRIATKSFVIIFLPIIPLETVVYYLLGDKYIEVFYPAGKGKVYWKHVSNNFIFYLAPLLLLIGIIFWIAG